ncbi:MAG: hypothetical protein EOO10_02475 [Chitinophagaceae bacterium]|nr:MAG: hypothetical protein EOO10_02475 [Chitinophagaceae bacterium]
MIPFNELRIGNYVMADEKMQRISLINNSKASLLQTPSVDVEENESGETQHSFASIKPVPLSDDILRQCNFVYHDYFKFWQLIRGEGQTRSEMDIDGDYNVLDFMRKPVVKNLASLHQLQNVYFMLKGQELPFHKNEA